ncbi:CRISPR-associated protein Cmr6 (plasmid) [Leptolyngbya sp. BL0902]|uniref:RAMP superfamily CRISPR-associated protein n=1 Tax=Leptolyngbya sp. BL0902 TaxID=1115757 RepID=UPI0018E86DEB|nr:RAMP superfamily CRISPR-associated protein [Leptolyngbya sp. BL0902]QQE67394.1 CRISPR-associated protein Cmr6 [Leptolyngbya sp. BL0902]
MVDPLKKPQWSEKSKSVSRSSQQSNSNNPKRIIPSPKRKGSDGGSNGGSGGNGGRGGGNGGEPSPWLITPDATPDPTASFVEYLRWMRAYQKEDGTKDATKVQILQMAEEKANYRDRLNTLTNRTKLIAGEGNTFQVKCLWRIRVGGHRGPESILLPAFDALGMPYIPASTLRGVARTQAIRERMEQEGLSWKQAEEKISRQYFGYLDSKWSEERSGKVVFLDAYPLPQQSGKGGGLTVDMANNIWSWDAAGRDLLYSPNPNPFYSLNEATFLIGLRSTSAGDPEILEQVKQWLSRGLASGIGSQVNTGYGSLVRAGQKALDDAFFSLDFTLEGQLIHGRQKFTQWGKNKRDEWQMRGNPDAEVRPVAFKSMLRYWFRAFALGVLPSREVQQLEGQLFGAINPKQVRGWLKFRTIEYDSFKETKDDPAQQQGNLTIYPSDSFFSSEHKDVLKTLTKSLVWLAFHLGGVGQGARRPCYSRNGNPRWRGSSFLYDEADDFWELPESLNESKKVFQIHFSNFHKSIEDLLKLEKLDQRINAINKPLSALDVEAHTWVDAVDKNCVVLIIDKKSNGRKSFSLDLLHQQLHTLENDKKWRDAKSLCGGAKTDRVLMYGREVERKAVPSPILISEFGDYQIVTVFGATQNPRRCYLDELKRQARGNYVQIFPFA